jgi:hypothetical protein
VGFSVFDQAHAMVNTPQSPVPSVGNYGPVNYYRFGSGARIALPCVASLATLEGYTTTSQVSWDFVNQQVVPYAAAFAADTISNAVWASTGGGQVTFTVGTDISGDIGAGDVITTTGVVSTSNAGVYNGTWVVKSATSTTVVVTYLASASPGTYSSGGTITSGGGLLPVKLLDFNFGNSMVPVYNVAAGTVTWNRSGNCAVLLI